MNRQQDRPNHRYYRTNHGVWTSPFEFRITSWRRFWASRMSLFDRLQALSLALVPRLIGRFRMDTTLDYHTAGLTENFVVHTTKISKWGVTLFDSREEFTLDPNGRDVAISGRRKNLWKVENYDNATCRVNAAGTEATYTFPWFGGTLHQVGSVRGWGAQIFHTGDWFHGVQELRSNI